MLFVSSCIIRFKELQLEKAAVSIVITENGSCASQSEVQSKKAYLWIVWRLWKREILLFDGVRLSRDEQ